MKVGDLKKYLAEIENDDLLVVIQKDSEGNGYSPLCGLDSSCLYNADSTYSGEVYQKDDDDAQGVPVLILYPIN